MRIEKDHLNIDDGIGAKQAMEACMGAIADLLIYPNEDLLTEEEASVIAVVGATLKTIAQKAEAYEDVYEKGILPQNSQN